MPEDTTVAHAVELENITLGSDLDVDGSNQADSLDGAEGEARPTKGNGTRQPWGFKSFPKEEKNAAITRAGLHKMAVQDWVALAIRTRIQWERDQETAVIKQEAEAVPAIAPPTIEEMDKMVSMIERLATATLEPPPSKVADLAYRCVRERLQAGVPPRRRKAKGPDLWKV